MQGVSVFFHGEVGVAHYSSQEPDTSLCRLLGPCRPQERSHSASVPTPAEIVGSRCAHTTCGFLPSLKTGTEARVPL